MNLSEPFIRRPVATTLIQLAIVIFVFTMGNMACSQGNAPAVFCRVLGDITGSAKP